MQTASIPPQLQVCAESAFLDRVLMRRDQQQQQQRVQRHQPILPHDHPMVSKSRRTLVLLLDVFHAEEKTDLIKSTFEVSVSTEQSYELQADMLTNRVQVTLADQQRDKDSPLYSVKTFEELGLSAF